MGKSTATTIIDGGGNSLTGHGVDGVTIALSYLTYRRGSLITHDFNDNITFNADHVRVEGGNGFAPTHTAGTLTPRRQ